jgi:tRNA/rRNA methyltransferase
LIVAYEVRLSAFDSPAGVPSSARAAATAGELENALDELRQALLAIGYLNPENPDAILAEFRGFLARCQPSPREVSLLRGVARQVSWAGRRIARAPGGSG